MATIQSKIDRVLRLIGVVAAGETSPVSDSTNALEALNAMLDTWRTDKLMVYALKDISITLINGTATYTIGASGAGTTDTAPIRIESAFVRDGTVDYGLKPITDAQYQAKSEKTITSDIPAEYLLTNTYPNSTVTLYPVPTVANTLKIRVWTPLTSVALTDTYAFPPGYEEAIVFNLCMRIYPEYPSIQVNPAVAEIARTSLASVKRLNAKPFIAITQLAKMFTSNHTKVDITADE